MGDNTNTELGVMIMGMGNYANYADTVTNDFVTETCPEEMAGLLKVLAENDYSLEQLAMSATDGGDIEGELGLDLEEEAAKAIMEAYETLCMTFQDKTQGLSLDIRYKDHEDRGDEVDGVFWEVDNVYELTTAGKKYNKQIERKFWTNFG
jgi:hypothetical protein